ncbi:MAG TPA: hypothetical protein VIY47_14965, partial [Ignavibacteriaceae bacterium]
HKKSISQNVNLYIQNNFVYLLYVVLIGLHENLRTLLKIAFQRLNVYHESGTTLSNANKV